MVNRNERNAHRTKCGAERINEERQRQIEGEGFLPRDDLQYTDDELIVAAIQYLANAMNMQTGLYTSVADHPFPFPLEWDKRQKHSQLKSLTIAGALCAAEIDRLQNQIFKDG